jgi:hypothetical protein
MKGNRSLLEIRKELSGQLLKAQELRPPEGVATGLQQLDDFLLWQGLPLGHLSLFYGDVGTGRTSLWLRSAAQVLAKGGWCCWINSEHQLRPDPSLFQPGDLARLLIVQPPPERKKVLFSLQEVCSSQIFDLVGVDVDSLRLTTSDGVRLQKWARQNKLALVLISRSRPLPAELMSFILNFNSPLPKVERALHKPTPYFLQRPYHENSLSEIFHKRAARISS